MERTMNDIIREWEESHEEDEVCPICEGTGIIQHGWGKGFDCSCKEKEASDDPRADLYAIQ